MNRRRFAVLVASSIAALAYPVRAAAQDEFALDAERLTKALELTRGQTVADIGAGAGELTVKLARVVGPTGRLYSTELEPDRIRAIRRAASSARLKNVTVLEAHATRTNLDDQCCDALVMRLVYHHIKNPVLMNQSLYRSLKSGGRLAIIDFPPDSGSADPSRRRGWRNTVSRRLHWCASYGRRVSSSSPLKVSATRLSCCHASAIACIASDRRSYLVSKLRFRISMSLDGFIAGPNQSVENPLGVGGERLHEWAFPLAAFRAPHGQEGGEVNESTPVLEESLRNIGATIMGRNMFGGHPGPWSDAKPWNGWWGEDPPFHHPVFVLTHYPAKS